MEISLDSINILFNMHIYSRYIFLKGHGNQTSKWIYMILSCCILDPGSSSLLYSYTIVVVRTCWANGRSGRAAWFISTTKEAYSYLAKKTVFIYVDAGAEKKLTRLTNAVLDFLFEKNCSGHLGQHWRFFLALIQNQGLLYLRMPS